MKKNSSKWLMFVAFSASFISALFYLGFKKVTTFETTVREVALTTGIYSPVMNQGHNSDLKANYELALTNLEQCPLNLSELKGKVIFMKFWASWCPPCVAELPHLNRLFQRVSNENIIFLMISKDESIQSVRRFMQKKGYDFPVHQIKGPLPAVFESSSIPVTFVISPEGNIVYKKKGMTNYNNEDFQKFLTELTKK